MKVFVSQGHERGIGLEVFLKSCLMLGNENLKLIVLVAFKDSVIKTLKQLSWPFELSDEHIMLAGEKINVHWLTVKNHSESFDSLKMAMNFCESGGVLFTLPTSKDQFPHHHGHTEFFRDYYQTPNLVMFFSGPDLKVLLLSDHIPISSISLSLTSDAIFERIKTAFQSFKTWNWSFGKILISGFNPHAGEGGMIGSEEEHIRDAIKRLRSKVGINVAGPYPGDTMLFEKKSSNDLLIYLFHDQGLGVFKGLQGFIGSNITLGLPYPRFSPDHGTSFSLFGKNQADYRGCEYSLKESIVMLKRLKNGKNTSYKGKSSQSQKY